MNEKDLVDTWNDMRKQIIQAQFQSVIALSVVTVLSVMGYFSGEHHCRTSGTRVPRDRGVSGGPQPVRDHPGSKSSRRGPQRPLSTGCHGQDDLGQRKLPHPDSGSDGGFQHRTHRAVCPCSTVSLRQERVPVSGDGGI
jgi:hypothetical protein